MRIAVCDSRKEEIEQLTQWIQRYCGLYTFTPEMAGFPTADAFFKALALRRFDIIFIGFDGPEGLLTTRHLREIDKYAKIVFVCDTAQYAVTGMRLHLTDYIVRPMQFKHVVRALQLAGIGGGGA